IADEVAGDTAALTDDHALHLSRVLRAHVGQQFDIAAGGCVRRGTITSISNNRVEFALSEEQALSSPPCLTLALAIFKFDRMEWAIEKCTEIGAMRIIPVIASRTDTHLARAATKRRERWQRLALQASEQSRRSEPPEIAVPVPLKELLNDGSSSSVDETSIPESRIVLSESEMSTLLRDVLPGNSVA